MRFGIHLRCLCGGPLGLPLGEEGNDRARVVTYQCGICDHQFALQLQLRDLGKAPQTAPTVPLGPICHGTTRGYDAHLRRGEPACEECSAANARASREKRRRLRGVA